MEAKLLKPSREAGFTLMEVMVALVILGVVMLGFQAAATGRLLQDVAGHDRRTVAAQLASERLRAVQLDPVYTELERRYAETRAAVPDFAGFRRSTRFETRVSGTAEYKVLTVTVEHDRLARPARRTLVIAAP